LHPDIVFYNEHHRSGDDIAEIMKYDFQTKPDMLIVMGTSLSLPMLNNRIRDFSKLVHSQGGLVILINKEKVATHKLDGIFDYLILGNVDEWAVDVAHHWRNTKPSDWHDDEELPAEVIGSYQLAEDISAFQAT
jgi:NAD-dependent SIR2 family protein deacetylase